MSTCAEVKATRHVVEAVEVIGVHAIVFAILEKVGEAAIAEIDAAVNEYRDVSENGGESE